MTLRRVARWIGLGAALLAASAAAAADLSSASFTQRGGHVNAGGHPALTAAGPRYSVSGASLGQAGGIGWSGRVANLETSSSGFWAIGAGGLPSLDVDGDLLQGFFDLDLDLDLDDDDDGLLDVFETRTGIFVSPMDAGSDPVDPDSDGDGFNDGEEVAAGSNPVDPGSVPAPALPVAAQLALVAALLLSSWGWRARTRAATA